MRDLLTPLAVIALLAGVPSFMPSQSGALPSNFSQEQMRILKGKGQVDKKQLGKKRFRGQKGFKKRGKRVERDEGGDE